MRIYCHMPPSPTIRIASGPAWAVGHSIVFAALPCVKPLSPKPNPKL